MTPLRLSDRQLAEVRQAALMVPLDLRGAYLERLAEALRGHDLGDGFVHRTAYEIARAIVWNADRKATG
jgi:hypothetical protein